MCVRVRVRVHVRVCVYVCVLTLNDSKRDPICVSTNSSVSVQMHPDA